ncbi:MAG TPA: hypothetical protein VD999_04150 [Vitreimonas sp.]|nr:hypothetical protein [Vitreimonas sp.]
MATSTSIISAPTVAPDTTPPQRRDEEWAGGHMPNPNGDEVDHLLEEMDLYTTKNDDEAHELNVAQEINNNERSRHFDIEEEDSI